MTTQEQDKLWNELSEESKKRIDIEYKESMDGSDLKRSIDYLFGSHNLNPKPLTYDMIAMEMYYEERTGTTSVILPTFSDAQANKLSAIHQLITVAKYLNGDWKPDWEDDSKDKWYIEIWKNEIRVTLRSISNSSITYFRTEELAEQAIQILGEETIHLALSTDY